MILLAIVTSAFAHAADAPLALARAIEAAVASDPLAARYQGLVEGGRADAAAAGALAPPELTLGVENLPIDSLALGREDMTMVTLGVRQALPAWGVRSAARDAAERRVDAEVAAGAERALAVARAVREAFALVAGADEVLEAVATQSPRARAAVDAAAAGYAAGSVPQQDLIAARLALADLIEMRLRASADGAAARAGLARWVGPALAALPLLDAEPGRSADLTAVRVALAHHPLLEMDAARVAAAEADAERMRAERRPELMLDLRYGFRSGDDLSGAPRSDMVSAMVSVSLPFASPTRSDARVTAASAEARAVRADRADRERELGARLDAAWARWSGLVELERLYTDSTLPDARLGAAGAMAAYGAVRSDYAALAAAQRSAFEITRKRAAITVERRLAQIELLYLEGTLP